MKRSEINRIVADMENLVRELGYALPAWAYWTPGQWGAAGPETAEIRDNHLGWDVTDFGLGRYRECGFALFTLRNGNVARRDLYPKPYAEKFLMMHEGQRMCTHYHWNKMEDIINRGGNDLYIGVWNGTADNKKLDTPVTVSCDGIRTTVPAGGEILLHPGQSITITPYLYHLFRVPATGGSVLLGEVSMCNDDDNDNCFYEAVGRFPKIEENEPAYRLLCTEYPA